MYKSLFIFAGILALRTAAAQNPSLPAADSSTPAGDEPPLRKPLPLLDTGSFEAPRVNGRTPRAQGGNPVMPVGKREWIFFEDKRDDKDGGLIAGLTNEIAHTRKQSLYVTFDKLTASSAKAELATTLISILPGNAYHVAIWGRVDKKNPLTLDQRLPILGVEVDFFLPDKETQTGEPIIKIQPMPGSLNRPPLFTPDKWAEFFADVTSPEDATYMKVTWRVATPPGTGAINGTVFFDDANIRGIAGKTPDELAEETPEPPEAPDPAKPETNTPASATPATATPATPPPAATPKPKTTRKK